MKHLTLAALALGALTIAGCKSNAPAPITTAANQQPTDPNYDPASVNLAPDGNTQVMSNSASYTAQSSQESYPQNGQQQAPIVRSAPASQGYADQQYTDASYDQGAADEAAYESAQAPPPLPEYDQPPAPADDYLWTPGYWGYNNAYYWVPGAWVAPPYYGALWTPPYWGYSGNRYRFHRGYWGPHVGYYGGINYGYGYIGIGYFGGYWHGHDFYYNRAVTRVSPRVTNIYERNVVYNNVRYEARPTTYVSYNGGRGGINVQPRPQEIVAFRERHVGPDAAQVQVRQQAMQNRQQFFDANHGHPAQAVFTAPAGDRTRIAERGAAPPNPGALGRGPENRGPENRGAEPNRAAGPVNETRPVLPNNQFHQNQIQQQQNAQQQLRNQQDQQHNAATQQRNAEEQQRRNLATQQQNAQQHNAQIQQHNQQLDQRNQQNALHQQQLNQQNEQRNQMVNQQRHQIDQQRNDQANQQNAQRQAIQNQQREAQRAAQQQARQPQPRPEQPRQQQQPRVEQPRPQPAPQPAPQPHVEAPHPAPAPAPAQQPHPGGGEHGGNPHQPH